MEKKSQKKTNILKTRVAKNLNSQLCGNFLNFKKKLNSHFAKFIGF
jgi:hypothetical protein